MKATLQARLTRVEAALTSAPACERGRGFIVDGDTVIDRDTGKEPDRETLRKIRAGEPAVASEGGRRRLNEIGQRSHLTTRTGHALQTN
jgi:hypothetical protein